MNEEIHLGLDDLSSKEKRDQMLEEASRFFHDMKSKMESGDPQQKELARQTLAHFQLELRNRKNDCCTI